MAKTEVLYDESILFTELTAEQYEKGMAWLKNPDNDIPSYEWAEHEPTWVRLVTPTDAQKDAFIEAASV